MPSTKTPLQHAIEASYAFGYRKGFEKGRRQGVKFGKRVGFNKAARLYAAEYGKRKDMPDDFKRGIEWERGHKVESMQIPITRDGKEIFLTVVKKAVAK